jgi:hypothetical protein
MFFMQSERVSCSHPLSGMRLGSPAELGQGAVDGLLLEALLRQLS